MGGQGFDPGEKTAAGRKIFLKKLLTFGTECAIIHSESEREVFQNG